MRTKQLLLSAILLSSTVVAVSQENSAVEQPTFAKVQSLASETIPLEEGQVLFYHETFNKIGGSLESPIELPVDSKRNIDPSLLDWPECVVGIEADARGVGGGIMINDEKKGYIGIILNNLEGRHRKFDLYFRIYSADPEKKANFQLGFYEMFIQTGSLMQGEAMQQGDETFYYVPLDLGGTQTSIEFTNTSDVGIVLDEVFVIVSDTVLNGPIVRPATEIGSDGFTANWRYSYDAKGGLFDAFTYADEATEHEPVTVSEQFAGINVSNNIVDAEDANMPESWTYRFSKEADKKAEAYNDGYAIYLNRTIENITTPNFDELTYSAFSFDFKGAKDSKASLIVEERIPFPIDEKGIKVRDGYKWVTLASLPLADYTDFTTIDLTDKLSGQGIYYRFRMSEDDLTNGAAVSNINFTYGGGTYYDKVYVDGFHNLDVPVELNSMAIAGLDPSKDYFYRVRAYDDNYISDYSYKMSGKGNVYGSDVVSPVALDATNVDDKNGSFTANWEFNPLFDYKICEVWKEVDVKADQSDMLVFSADFSKVKGGNATAENPKLESFTVHPTYYYVEGLPGFSVKYAAYADGMFGVHSGSSFGTLQSPVYSLGDGNLTLKLNIVAGTIGDECLVTCYNDETGDFSSTRKITVTEIPQTVELQFPASNYTYFVFTYKNSDYILFDQFDILVDAKEGDFMLAMVDEKLSKNSSEDFVVKNIANGDSYFYTLKHWYVVGNEYSGTDQAMSDYSNYVYVWQNYVTGLESVQTEDDVNIYAAPDGTVNMKLNEDTTVYIYNTSGMLVDSFEGVCGYNSYKLTDKGIYVIVAGDERVKVVY